MEVLCLWTLWTPCRVSQGEVAVVVWVFYKYGSYTRKHQLCPFPMTCWGCLRIWVQSWLGLWSPRLVLDTAVPQSRQLTFLPGTGLPCESEGQSCHLFCRSLSISFLAPRGSCPQPSPRCSAKVTVTRKDRCFNKPRATAPPPVPSMEARDASLTSLGQTLN